jgi:FHA domain
MPACPAGHDSESSDFCDTCGTPLGVPAAAQLTAMADPPGEPCPRCGAARSGQFCETCGFDFVNSTSSVYSTNGGQSPAGGPAPERAARGAWTAVVSADWLYYGRVLTAGNQDATALPFPGSCTERQFRLTGPQMRIGRRSVSRGIQPEIDLTGPPADLGISRLHAVLTAGPEGGWTVLDRGSENGTLVNDKPIAAGEPVALADGDRIHLGLWTVIVVQAP